MKFWTAMGTSEKRQLSLKQNSNNAQTVNNSFLIFSMIVIMSLLNVFKLKKISGLSIWKLNLTALLEKLESSGLNNEKFNQNLLKKQSRLLSLNKMKTTLLALISRQMFKGFLKLNQKHQHSKLQHQVHRMLLILPLCSTGKLFTSKCWKQIQ